MKVGGNDQACLHLTNDGTHMGGVSTLTEITSFTLALLLLQITHHSAPHKKVTVVKDGHALAHDLMNWRSRALAASDAPELSGVGDGRERSCGVGVVSGETLRGNGNDEGVGVIGLIKRS